MNYKAENKCACVVVIGDLGRSPRMQYHALSLATEGFEVDVIGYDGSEPVAEVKNHPNIILHYLSNCPDFSRCPLLLAYVLRTFWIAITLFCSLVFKRRSHHLIVQNPPAIPSLAVCWFYCFLANTKFTIDWHNYGHTIMALKLGHEHKLVKMMKWCENYFGKKANANICVTVSMKADLQNVWGIEAVALYDRPPESFHPLSLEEQCQFIDKLSLAQPEFAQFASRFTQSQFDGSIELKEDCPGLLISSTSWTEDEDFSYLLAALGDYEKIRACNKTLFPKLLCVITGKGPLKEHYCQLIANAAWKHVEVITPWLHANDYPKLLACADLGVCLHTSSSGLDLPMKVVDMFGCCLPVLAYDFPCLHELVRHGENSLTFKTSDELATSLQSWFRRFPNNARQQEINKRFKKQINTFQELRWHENWLAAAHSLFI